MESEFKTILDKVRAAAEERIIFLPHAIRQMSRPERMISRLDIRAVIFEGEVIEDYPDDQRGHSCLMLGFDAVDRPIHLVCSPKNEYLAIITAYLPYEDEWSEDFRSRE